MGSKISVIIIVLAMVLLAGVLIDDTQENISARKETSSELLTYADLLKIKGGLESREFVFENYLILDNPYDGEIAPVDFGSNPLARAFESIIVRSVETIGANYAGKYNVATWSCGKNCQSSAIINVENGSIVTYGIISAYGLAYSPSSALFVINPEESLPESGGEDTSSTATDYYMLTEGEEFILVSKKIAGESVLEGCIQATASARNFLTNEIVKFPTPCSVPFGWEIISNK